MCKICTMLQLKGFGSDSIEVPISLCAANKIDLKDCRTLVAPDHANVHAGLLGNCRLIASH